MRTSYSSLSTFQTCPLKYKFQEIDKIRAPKNIEAVFGSSVHSALKYMFQRSPLYPALNQVIDYFRDTWDQRKTAIIPSRGKNESNEGESEEDSYCKQGIILLENFYKRNQPWNFNVVDLESRFETEIEDAKTNEKHILAGIIDRIDKNNDDAYEIIDYKTARKMPAQKDIDNDLQISIYHLGLLKRWPHLAAGKIKLSFYFLKHREKISTARTEQQLESTRKTVLNIINDINGRIKNNYNFSPTPSGLCDWCGYRRICPMWKHLYAEEEKDKIKNQNELKAVVKDYFELKNNNQENNERIDELKILIFAFMDRQKVERVFGDDGYLTRRVTEKFSYDLNKIKEILEPIGKWSGILEPDEKKLEKIIPYLPEDIKEKIANFHSVKKITTLTASRKKGVSGSEKDL